MSARIAVADSFMVVAEPGDGTRYELCVFQREGGGWAVTWEAKGLVARLRGFSALEGLEPVSKGWSKYDRDAVLRILDGLFFIRMGRPSPRGPVVERRGAL